MFQSPILKFSGRTRYSKGKDYHVFEESSWTIFKKNSFTAKSAWKKIMQGTLRPWEKNIVHSTIQVFLMLKMFLHKLFLAK